MIDALVSSVALIKPSASEENILSRNGMLFKVSVANFEKISSEAYSTPSEPPIAME